VKSAAGWKSEIRPAAMARQRGENEFKEIEMAEMDERDGENFVAALSLV
jgi:hypothetical protein